MLTSRKSFALSLAAAYLPLSFGCMDEGIDSEGQSAEIDSVESDLELGLASDISADLAIDPGLFFDGCKTAAADKTYYVTSSTAYLAVPSPHGGYGYGDGLTDFCRRWVVDFKFGTASTKRVLSGLPYDLPSSEVALGTWPKNAEDCTRLRVYTSIYRKKSTETSFTLLTSKVAAGTWHTTGCSVPVATASASSSASGWDTYRVAVATKLRASWQQTAAVVNLPPPH